MQFHRSTRLQRWAVPPLAALSLTFGLSACGDATSSDAAGATGSPSSSAATAASSVEAVDPWVRATTDTEDPTMSAAFMTLKNTSDQDVALVGARTEAAGMVQLHEMASIDGAMVMQEAPDGFTISAGRGKVLQPGGFHIMLMQVASDLAAGDEVELTLVFSDGSEKTLTAPVKVFTEETGHYHAPGTEHGSDSPMPDSPMPDGQMSDGQSN